MRVRAAHSPGRRASAVAAESPHPWSRRQRRPGWVSEPRSAVRRAGPVRLGHERAAHRRLTPGEGAPRGMRRELAEDAPAVPPPEDEGVVDALAPDRPREPPRVGAHVRRPRLGADSLRPPRLRVVYA